MGLAWQRCQPILMHFSCRALSHFLVVVSTTGGRDRGKGDVQKPCNLRLGTQGDASRWTGALAPPAVPRPPGYWRRRGRPVCSEYLLLPVPEGRSGEAGCCDQALFEKRLGVRSASKAVSRSDGRRPTNLTPTRYMPSSSTGTQ